LILPENFLPEPGDKLCTKHRDVNGGFSIKAAQIAVERKLIEKALLSTGGNRTKAALLLEISHPSLLTKIKAYNIKL